MPNNTHTFRSAQELVLHFEVVLNRSGIDIRTGSVLERLCLNTVDLYEKHHHPELRPDDSIDVRRNYRELVGLFDLIVKLVSCESHRSFPQLVPHLRLLNEANPLQNIDTSILNQDNNKIFELYIAALCLGVPVDDLALDDPYSSKGDNPDVLATYAGKRWGLACKALHSLSPKTIMDNVKKAIEQIERSEADIGVPVLSLKNKIDHAELWPVRREEELTGAPSDALVFFSFPTSEQPVRMLAAYTERIRHELIQEFGQQQLLEFFEGRKAQPGCLLYLPSATSVVHNGLPVATRLNLLSVLAFGELNRAVWELTSALHHRLQLSDR